MSLADITWRDNLNAGTATFSVSSGYVAGSQTGSFEIKKIRINSSDVVLTSIPMQYYSGKPLEPSPSLSFNDSLLSEDIDYECLYSGNDGKSSVSRVSIVGKGNFEGKRDASFDIKGAPLTRDK